MTTTARDARPQRRFEDAADVIVDLPDLVRWQRQRKGLSVRATGRAVGVDPMTILRLERGGSFSAETAAKVLRWLADVSR